jgi:hypothetical protein
MMVLSTIWKMSACPLSASRASKIKYAYLLQLLILQIASHHHLQHDKQLAIANVPIAIDIVNTEGKPQLLLLISFAAKGRQSRDKLLKVDVAAAVLVENGNHARGQRVGRNLRKSQELIAVYGARVVLVQLHKSLP